jgi:polo-like kinase 1
VEPDALPEVWVTKWVDYSSRYGVVYQLPDGAIGVYFNDSTKIICLPDGTSFDYIPRSTAEQQAVRSTHTFEDYPVDLHKKVTLLRYFRSTMATDILGKREGAIPGESMLPKSTGTASNQVYVRKWSRRGSAIMFSLSNKDIQVVFFDKTEVVLSFRNHTVTYSDKCGSMQTSSLSQALDNPSADLSKRLRYILSNLLGVASSDLPAALRM